MNLSITRLLYNGKRKIQANILCQLRSGINRLNKYLAKINAVESDQCKCGRGEESVDHFLFRCPRWSIFRGEICRLAGWRWGDTSSLLGGWSGEPEHGDAAKWKPANEMVTANINFAIATGRLEDRRKGRGESDDEQSESDWKGHQRAKQAEETHANSKPLANKSTSFRPSTSISPMHDYWQPEYYPRIGAAIISLWVTVVTDQPKVEYDAPWMAHLKGGVSTSYMIVYRRRDKRGSTLGSSFSVSMYRVDKYAGVIICLWREYNKIIIIIYQSSYLIHLVIIDGGSVSSTMAAILGNKIKKFCSEYVQNLITNTVCYLIILYQH